MNNIHRRKTTAIFLILLMIVTTIEIFLIPSVSSASSTYFVSKNGNDINGDGSFTNPWRTIQKAANSVNAGDTVYVRGGTYYEEVSIKNKQGNPDVWTTFRPYNNEEVIVDGTYLSTDAGHSIFQTSYSSYIHITGFKIYNSACRGISINDKSKWILIDYNNIFNCSSNGIITYNQENILFQHNIVDNVNNNWAGNGVMDEGVTFARVRNFDISYNKISRCGKECIDVKYGCEYGNVHHNEIDTSTWPEDPVYTINGITSIVSHTGIYCDGWTMRTHDINIYNNYIHGNHGMGIICGVEQPTGSVDHLRIYNNVIDVSYGAAIGVINFGSTGGGPVSDISIFSNTAIADAFYALSLGSDNIAGVITVSNNIFVTRTGGGYGDCVMRVWNYLPSDNKVALNNNLFHCYTWGTGYKNIWDGLGDVSWGDNAIIADPKFVSTSDFHLKSSSPAVNVGDSSTAALNDFDGVSRPQEGSVDIGAYEYHETTSDTTPPILSNIQLKSSTILDVEIGWENITCTATDDNTMHELHLTITDSNYETSTYTMLHLSGTSVYYYNTSLKQSGNYTYYVSATDTSSNTISSSNMFFSMPPNWDIDNDGICGILDIVSISNEYRRKGAKGWIRQDVNNDGIVQVLDLVYISIHLTESWWI